MYCAGCGQVLNDEQRACPQCGHSVIAVPPSRTSDVAAAYVFERTIRRLRQYWFLFACLNVALGVAGLVMVQAGLSPHVGPWEPWPHPPYLQWTYTGGSAWTLLIFRVALGAASSIGLRDRTDWARPVTVLAAAVAITQFPIGLMLGAFTLVKLVGKRNAELFRKFRVHSS